MSGRIIVVVAASLALVAVACSGDGGPEGAATPRDPGSPVPVPSPNLPPLGEPAVEALRLYLQDTGLDGNEGDLTDPIDCTTAELISAEGEFCLVVDAGHYAPALAILFVTYRGSGDSWQIHVDLDVENSVWKVTDIDFLSAE